MKRNRVLVGVLFLVLVALMQVACVCSAVPRVSRSSSRSNHHSRGDFTHKTETKVDALEVRPDMTTVKLDVYAKLSSGSMQFLLADPNGEVRWEEEITAPDRYREVRRFDPVVGDWTLELTLEDASGSYDIQWSATD